MGRIVALAALVLAVGMGVGGWFVGRGFTVGRASDRYVTVKGVSEMNVEADLALWPIQLTATDNNLAVAQREMTTSVARVFVFLAENAIDTTEVDLQGFRVTDMLAQRYRGDDVASRYIISQTVMVRSPEPRVVFAASQRVGELVKTGIVFSSGQEYGPSGPIFIFGGLNDIKPSMIADATQKAREAAERFARDSASEIVGIRRANQGVFVILPRDQAPGIQEQQQLHKTVRVVSTIEYLLDD